jgi:hypothetical protein
MADNRLDIEARKLLDLRRDHEEKDRAAKLAKEKRSEQEDIVYELMGDLNQPSTTLELGEGYGTIRLTRPKPTLYSRIIDKDVALASIEEAGRTEEMFDFEIRKAPANQWIKELMENGEDLPPGFDYSESRRITVTRKKEGR